MKILHFGECSNMSESRELGKYCFRLCSYLALVHKTCSIVRMHLQCSHVTTESLLKR